MIAGFRYMIGADTENYYLFFKKMVSLDELNSNTLSHTRFQPGYSIFISFVKTIFGYFFVLQLIVALFLNFTLYAFITKHTKYLFTTFLVYFIINYLEFNTEIQRESIAISFGLISYMLYERKKYVIAALLVLFALEFHISAIVIVLYPILERIKFSYTSYFIILVFICGIIPSTYVAIPDLYGLVSLVLNLKNWNIDQFVGQELNDKWNMNFYLVHTAKNVVLPFLMILYIERRQKTNLVGYVYMWCTLQFLNMYSYGFYRFANYFAPFVWLYYSLFIVTFIKQHFYKIRIIIMVLFSALILYFYQDHLLRHDGGFLSEDSYKYERYFPYKSIFTEGVY